MPRTKPAKRIRVLRVDTETHKCSGAVVRCCACGYRGAADVVNLRSRRNGSRSLERCPECKSLNIICEEKSIVIEHEWKTDEWENCYPSQWKGTIVPEAMAHPAKFSSRLIRRIYEHMFDEGWLVQGNRVLDPFGGVALGALHAMEFGLEWVGNELEPRFVELGAQNLAMWRNRFSAMPHWGSAVLLQGDSRKLAQIVRAGGIQQAEGSISSPPYTSNVKVEKNSRGVDISKQYETYKNSGGGQSFEAFVRTQELHSQGYGDSDGQMANMKTSTDGFQAALSSPPYKNETQGAGLNVDKPATFRGVLKDGSLSMGDSDGNIANMDDRNFEAAISSPPFRHSTGGTPEPKPGGVIDERLYARHAAGNSAAEGYGATEGQLGNMPEGDLDAVAMLAGIYQRIQGDDFWLAARLIVEQVFELLEPGGHACWVVKDFVRDGAIMPFSDKWRQLCEAVGFLTVHEHRAMLVHRKGASLTLEGELVEHKTESKSFFRRIAERKGSPRVDWEVVWCMEKPL